MSGDTQEQPPRDPLVHRVTNALGFLFSYMGGIGRGAYWLGLLIVLALLVISLVALVALLNPAGPTEVGFAVPPIVLALWMFSALTLKRLRHAGFSGWQFLMLTGGPALLTVIGLEAGLWPLALLGLLLLIAIPGFYPGKSSRTLGS